MASRGDAMTSMLDGFIMDTRQTLNGQRHDDTPDAGTVLGSFVVRHDSSRGYGGSATRARLPRTSRSMASTSCGCGQFCSKCRKSSPTKKRIFILTACLPAFLHARGNGQVT